MRLLAFAILVACVQSVCAQSILKDPKELSVLLNEVVLSAGISVDPFAIDKDQDVIVA